MKKLSLLIFYCFCNSILFAQVYKYRSDQVNFLHKDIYEKKNWKKSNVLIVQNFDKKVTFIYTKNEQRFDWIKVEELKDLIDSANHVVGAVKFTVIDQDGVKCILQVDMMYGVSYDQMLSITYADRTIMYIINKIN